MENNVLSAGLLFLLGFGLIIKGGDWFVDAAIWISEITGIPKFLVGATIVSVCTTLPELFVSSFAVLSGVPDLGIGNALGSVICNTGLILGISMIFLPAVVNKNIFGKKFGYLILSILMLGVFLIDLRLSLLESLILIAVLVLYIRYCVKVSIEHQSFRSHTIASRAKRAVFTNLAKLLFGVTGIVLGARLLVNNGTMLAKIAGIPDAIIGLTIVALGTSLPELVTTISAVIKKESSLSVGNIIGANILNILLIMSVCGILSPQGLVINLQNAEFFHKPIPQSLYIDLPVVLFVTLLVAVPGIIKGRLYRWQGFAVMGCYTLYLGYLAVSAF